MNTSAAKPKRRRQCTCRCPAYPFPHRIFSGHCEGPREIEPDSLVPYIHTPEAMRESGHSEKDFG
jgi:hypothetical protein